MGLLLAGLESCNGPKSYSFALKVSTDTKTITSIVKTVQRFRNMLHLSQMVLFLILNSGPWNCARYILSIKDQLC